MAHPKKKVVKRKVAKKVRPHLFLFYGAECTHSIAMMPLVKKLEHESRFRVERLEVWHSPRNLALMKNQLASMVAMGMTLGTPLFYNSKTGAALCGEQPYEVLKQWASGR